MDEGTVGSENIAVGAFATSVSECADALSLRELRDRVRRPIEVSHFSPAQTPKLTGLAWMGPGAYPNLRTVPQPFRTPDALAANVAI